MFNFKLLIKSICDNHLISQLNTQKLGWIDLFLLYK